MKVEGLCKPQGCKLIRISAEVEDGVIRDIQIRGDFFASPEEGFEGVERALRGVPAGLLAGAFDSLVRERRLEVSGIDGSGVAEAFRAALAAGEAGRGG